MCNVPRWSGGNAHRSQRLVRTNGADVAVAIDQQQDRDRGDREPADHRFVRIEQHVEGVLVLLDVLPGGLDRFTVVDRQHDQSLIGKLALRVLDLQHLFAAWRAPGGPEIYQYRLAFQRGGVEFLPREFLQSESGRASAYPRRAWAEG